MSQSNTLSVETRQNIETCPILLRTPSFANFEAIKSGFFLAHYHQHPLHQTPVHSVVDLTSISFWSHASETQMEYRIDGKTSAFKAIGDRAILIPHGTEQQAAWDQTVDFTAVLLKPNLIQRIAQDLVKGDCLELIPNPKIFDPILHNFGRVLKAEAQTGFGSGRLYSESIVTALVVRLLHHHAVCRLQLRSEIKADAQKSLKRLLDYVHAHLEQELSLIELAEQVGFSQYHLCHWFRQSMGTSLHQYIILQRVNRAKNLLTRSNLSLATIAMQCGFSSHSHLTRHFKRIVGVTPKEARATFSKVRSQDCTN